MKQDVTLAMGAQVAERILDNVASQVFQGKVRLNKLHTVPMSAAQPSRFSEIVQAPFFKSCFMAGFSILGVFSCGNCFSSHLVK